MILDVIVEDKKKRLPEHKKNISEEKMKELALSSTRKSISFYDALKKDGLSIIGEFKKASPSHGTMDNKIELDERIRQYSSSADANIVSYRGKTILTEVQNTLSRYEV